METSIRGGSCTLPHIAWVGGWVDKYVGEWVL